MTRTCTKMSVMYYLLIIGFSLIHSTIGNETTTQDSRMTAYDTCYANENTIEKENNNNEYVKLLNDVHCTLLKIHTNSPSSNENNKSN